MHEADPQAINALTNPDAGFETRDMKIAGLWKHIVGFFVYTIVMIGFVAALYDFALPMIYPREDGGVMRARMTGPIVPAAPNPKLQNGHEAIVDIVELKRKEQVEASSYGWVDKERGLARIPVEKAMDMVAESRMNVTFSPPKPPEAPRPASSQLSRPPAPGLAGAAGGGQ